VGKGGGTTVLYVEWHSFGHTALVTIFTYVRGGGCMHGGWMGVVMWWFTVTVRVPGGWWWPRARSPRTGKEIPARKCNQHPKHRRVASGEGRSSGEKACAAAMHTRERLEKFPHRVPPKQY
jgi:hypothetical protein